MNTRLATVLARQQYTADKTEPISIDIKDPISQLVVTYEPDNNPSGASATGHPALCIPKIEIVDGSDYLFSLSGMESQGVDFYHNKRAPWQYITYLNGMYSKMIFLLNFGRYLWDPELALVPTNFDNPQLNIQIDIDGGGDESNDGYLTVLANIFDAKEVSPIGFLMHKELKSFTLADSSHEYTDLPRDYPYKQLFVRAQRYGTHPTSQIANVKLSEDNDKKVPVDHTLAQVIDSIVSRWPMYEEAMLVWGSTTAQYFYCTPCQYPRFQDTQWRSAVATAEASIYGGGGGRFEHDAEAAGPNHQVFARGQLPHAVCPILPDFGDDYESWYDPAALGVENLKLDLTGGSSVGTSQTCQIIAQQLRRYAAAA